MERTVGVHLYVTASEHGVDVQTRMFAPLFGVPEDPATGSANVTLIGLLAITTRAPISRCPGPSARASTWGGRACSRPSAEKKAGKVVATYIGGRCVPMLSGTIDVDKLGTPAC